MTRPLRCMLQRSSILCLAVVLLIVLVAPVNGQVITSQRAPDSAIPLTGTYTQNFDTLANSGSSNTWANDATVAGWYSNRMIYIASTGTSTTGSIYSLGATGSTERALGSVASNTSGTIYFGGRFVNDTGFLISSLSITFTGEQWRNGGNTAQQTLEFSYQVGATVDDLTLGTWTDFDALDFTGPIATATAGALDGNVAANRAVLSQEMPMTILPGQEIMLRWSDLNDSGNDHGLAIDDLTVTASVLAVTLADFSASPANDHILITWETASELNNAGFNLYRSTTDAAPEELLTYVPSQAPGSQQGASYQWQDRDVAPGDTWWYWLEDIDLSGATTLHGPVSATMVGPTAVGLVGMEAGIPTESGDSGKWMIAAFASLCAAVVAGWGVRSFRGRQ